ncbi:alpha/beta hydrolase [Ekhidna sp.]
MNGLKVFVLVILILYAVGGVGLYLLQERLIFLPESLDQDYQYSFNQNFEEYSLKMKDGAIINTLRFTSDSSRGLILYFHGNAGNLARWGEVVTPFVDMGFEVLIPDYRGYGKSTGKRSDKKLLRDADELYSFAKTLEKEERIILFGRSLGSTFASYLAGKNTPRKVILETPFYSLKDVAKDVIPIYPTSYLLSYQFKSFEYLKTADSPIYIFHGTDDEVVPYESGKRLFESIEGNSKLFTIEGGHHNDLMGFDSYQNKMEEVLISN